MDRRSTLMADVNLTIKVLLLIWYYLLTGKRTMICEKSISSVRSKRLRRAFLSNACQEAPAASEEAVRRRGRDCAKP